MGTNWGAGRPTPTFTEEKPNHQELLNVTMKWKANSIVIKALTLKKLITVYFFLNNSRVEN